MAYRMRRPHQRIKEETRTEPLLISGHGRDEAMGRTGSARRQSDQHGKGTECEGLNPTRSAWASLRSGAQGQINGKPPPPKLRFRRSPRSKYAILRRKVATNQKVGCSNHSGRTMESAV